MLVINFESPPGQEIECRHGPRDTGAEGGPHAMGHFLAMEDRGEPRQHRFHQPPRVPSTPRTDLHGGGVTGLRMATRIGQADHRVDTLGNQGVQRRVMAHVAGAPSQAHITPHGCRMKPNWPPTIHR